MILNKRYFFFLISFLFTVQVFAQLTLVKGKVTDAETKESIPFANVVFKGTTMGTITDYDGRFEIQTSENVTEIEASYIGYKTFTKKIKQGEKQNLQILLEPEALQLGEVVLTAKEEKKKENPAHVMLRNIRENREKNSPESLAGYSFEKYEKIEFDLNNITEEFKEKKLFKQFQFIFDQVDTSDVNGKIFLPVFMTETLSDYYYRKDPSSKVEKIKANKVAGFQDNQSVNEFMGALYQDFDINDDSYITLFNKGFINPVAAIGLASYRYYLTDSIGVEGSKSYKIQFIPRRKHELTFKGELWVDSQNWAIEKIKLRVVDDANLNFVNDLAIEQDFQTVDGKSMLSRDYILMDFSAFKSKDGLGMYGIKTTTFESYKLNDVHPVDFYSITEEDVNPEALKKGEDFWAKNRHNDLSKSESGIYNMVDSLKNVPVFRTYLDIVSMVLTGHYRLNQDFEFGPISQTYSFNHVEGHRIRLGGRTTRIFNDSLEYSGFVAYGLDDDKIKYGIGGRKILDGPAKRTEIGLYIKKDIEQLSLANASKNLQVGNLLASALSRSENNKLALVHDVNTYIRRDITKELNYTIGLTFRDIQAQGDLDFDFLDETGKNYFRTTEIGLSVYYSPGVRYIRAYGVKRRALRLNNPIFNLGYRYGAKGIFGSEYEYHKAYLSLQHSVVINPLGRMIYLVELGKTFGDLPYPLLEIHGGNETFSYSRTNFNMMNFFEFISDQYVSVKLEHHFDGLFFNKIPLLRALNLREVASGKAVYGTLNDSNALETRGGELITAPTDVYYEAGFGVENILKLIRVEGVWRLSYLDLPDAEKFGIRVRLQLAF